MKKLITLLLILFVYNTGYSARPTYLLTAKNFVLEDTLGGSRNMLKFDIYMQWTNQGSDPFNYGSCQYCISVNASAIAGQTWTISKFSSDLPAGLQPTLSVNVATAQIRFTGNLTGPIFEVSSIAPGTLVMRSRIVTNASTFPNTNFGFKWRNVGSGLINKISYIDPNGLGVFITDTNSHKIEYFPSPELVSPASNSTNIPLSTNFIWKKVGNALTYKLQIASDSLLNNLIYSDSTLTDSIKVVSGFSFETNYFWRVGSKDSIGITRYSSPWKFTTLVQRININLTALMEAKYYPLFNIMSRRDTVKVYLRKKLSPYNLIDSSTGIIDSLTFSKTFSFFNSPTDSYYVVIKHYQCIETWSKAGGQYYVNDGNVYNYNFTSAQTQAFGNNLKLKGTKYCMFSGDIDKNGFIDVSDILLIFNDQTQLVTGNVKTDINGDNIVDSEDLIICFNNLKDLVSVISP